MQTARPIIAWVVNDEGRSDQRPSILDGNVMRSQPSSVVFSLHEDQTLVAVERSRYRCPRNGNASLLVVQRTSQSLSWNNPKRLCSIPLLLSIPGGATSIERFITWYCGEPRLAFNRSVVVLYRSFLESLCLSSATINLHLSAIRRLADESAESGWLSPELAIGIRRVKGVKWLGRRIGNWLTGNQAQELLNAVSPDTLRGRRDGAMLGLLLGCGLRRSEVVGLKLDQLQRRDSHWVIVDLVGKGGRIRTVPVPNWCKGLVDVWLRHSGVNEGKVFRRVLKNGARQDAGVTANVVWYAVKRCAKQAGVGNLAPHDLRRSCARICHGCGGELEQIQFLLGHASVQTTELHRMQAEA
jgi:integrase